MREIRRIFKVLEGHRCPHCKVGIIRKMKSKFGEFYGCSEFPNCAFTEKIPKEIKRELDINHDKKDIVLNMFDCLKK